MNKIFYKLTNGLLGNVPPYKLEEKKPRKKIVKKRKKKAQTALAEQEKSKKAAIAAEEEAERCRKAAIAAAEEEERHKKAAMAALEEQNRRKKESIEALTEEVLDKRPTKFENALTTTMELISDPVISDTGDVYEASSIQEWLKEKKTLPMTLLPFRQGELFAAPELKSVLVEYRREEEKVLHQLPEIYENKERVSALLENYAVVAKQLETKLEHAKDKDIQHKIQDLRDKLLLDTTNKRHLDYWEEKNFCNFSLKTVVADKRKRVKVAPEVYDVLMAANKEYKFVHNFRHAIEVAQNRRASGCCVSFWGMSNKAIQISEPEFLDSVASADWQKRLKPS